MREGRIWAILTDSILVLLWCTFWWAFYQLALSSSLYSFLQNYAPFLEALFNATSVVLLVSLASFSCVHISLSIALALWKLVHPH